MSKKFAMIGAAGFIAPRHMKAIKDTGNELIVALDPKDSVGIIDSYFPNAHFFTEFERFDRHIDKLRRSGSSPEFFSICSPNYLHDSHIRFALRNNADAICEKPLVINPWNLDTLLELEKESGKRVYTILQLRLHPSVIELKKKTLADPHRRYNVDLSYVTSRGRWYLSSWKGDLPKSGGVATNIGIHFFDMLHWLFGKLKSVQVHESTPQKMSGVLQLERADVKWMLSIDAHDLPDQIKASKQRTFRCISIDGKEIEFSEGFEDLHLRSYQNILSGDGFGINDARDSIETVYKIRTTDITSS